MIVGITAHDVRATITYTMAPSPVQGEASPGPIIGSGVLRVQSSGGTFVVPLSDLGIDTHHWSIFPQSPSDGCGAGAPLTIHRGQNGRNYVVVESIQVGKGCRAAASVIDVSTRKVVEEYSVDHASVHVNDVPASTFTAQKSLTVNNVERFGIPAGAPSSAWTLTVIQGSAVEFFTEDLSTIETPRPGEAIMLGLLRDQTFTAPLVGDDRVFRLSATHEQAWAARQTPVPVPLQRTREYNMYFAYSDRLAWDGHFAQALSMFRRALQYLDDAGLRQQEAGDIPRFAAIVQAVRDKRMTLAKAKKAWFEP